MENSTVLVVGAGPTGMTAAIELRRSGLDVRIVDRSTHLALHSQALGIQARTLEQFQRYGIAHRVVARGRKVTRASFRSEEGQILSVPLDRISSMYPFILMLPQTDTEAILNEHMESLGVRTERGVELLSIDQQNDSLLAVLRHPDGVCEGVRPRWLIGCDGAHSTVRDRLGIAFEGGAIGLSFFLGDVRMEGPDTPDDELSVHFHRGDVVFLARLTPNLVRVIVATHAMQNAELQKDLTIDDFQRAVDAAGIKARVYSPEWMTPFHVHDRQARHYREGNVFLAGDASHIHSPVGGQGMNTGIQDAANLAWKLAAVARGAREYILNTYEEERAQVGKALLRFTERGLKMATATNPLVEGCRDALLPLISILRPAQKHMLGFISETAIEYRSSSIVTDFGGEGHLRAGDRMPDLTLRKGGTTTTLLQNWTEARHIALLLEPTALDVAEVREGMPQAELVAVGVRDLDEEGLRALGTDKKFLIIRPDGYIGFRGHVEPHTPWMEYAEQDGILSPAHVAAHSL